MECWMCREFNLDLGCTQYARTYKHATRMLHFVKAILKGGGASDSTKDVYAAAELVPETWFGDLVQLATELSMADRRNAASLATDDDVDHARTQIQAARGGLQARARRVPARDDVQALASTFDDMAAGMLTEIDTYLNIDPVERRCANEARQRNMMQSMTLGDMAARARRVSQFVPHANAVSAVDTAGLAERYRVRQDK